MSALTSIHHEFSSLTLDGKPTNFDTFSLVWLDKQENVTVALQKKLQESIKYLKILFDSQKCIKWIEQRPIQEMIIVIIADEFVNEVLPHIHNLSGIVFYIHCCSVSTEEKDEWMKKYDQKICSISSNYDELTAKLIEHKNTHLKIEEEIARLKSASVITSSSSSFYEYSFCILEGDFLWFQLLIKVLLRMTHRKSDRQELITYCRRVYFDNQHELRKIEEFQELYTSKQALSWYTKDMCLYRLLNKALRTRDIKTLVLFRWFITDLYKQLKQLKLEQHQSDTSIIVYRGQLLSQDEMNRFKWYNKKNEKEHYFSFNSFLSTTLDPKVAMMFVPSSSITEIIGNEVYPVIFEIHIDSTLKYVQPYANIINESHFESEQEVLFMLGSIFQFKSLSTNDDKEGGIPTIKLQLASESDSKLKNLSRFMKRNLRKKRSDLILLADTLLNMGHYDSAQMYYERQLMKLTKIHVYKAGQCYTGLAQVAYFTQNYDLSIEYQKSALEVARSDSDKFKCDRLLADAYTKKSYFNSALYHYNESLKIGKKLYGEESVEVAELYRCLGSYYWHKEMYIEALDYCKQSLKIQKKKLPKNHYEIGKTFECMGHVYEDRKKWNTSLDYYVKADEIYREALTSNHPAMRKNHEDVHRVSFVIYRRERRKEKRAITTTNENSQQVEQQTASNNDLSE